jgi:sortase A
MTVRVTVSTRRVIANLFLIAGVICLGIYSYSYVSTAVYQYYEGWRFDRDRAQAESTPAEAPTATKPLLRDARKPAAPVPPKSTIGRLSVQRLNMSALVSEGVDDITLQHAIGHITGTPLPGQSGNVAVAGHRDSFFRSLKDLEKHDEIVFTTLHGSYRYVVDEMEVVEPTNVSVLAPTTDKMLTIVTCFPFRYIGPAPKRFIVRARQVEEISKSSLDDRKSRPLPAESSRQE